MGTYKLLGLLFALLSILFLLGCKTTVGKPYDPVDLDPYGFSELSQKAPQK